MSNPYTRTSTPMISYAGRVGEKDCFRLHLAQEEGLNAMLFRGEITELLLKETIDFRLGNTYKEVAHLPNPAKKDFFLLLARADVRVFTETFEVYGFSPDLFA